MAKAIFHRRFDFRRVGQNVAFTAEASPEPQSFPGDMIDAAVAAGAAERVPPKRKKSADGPETPGGGTPTHPSEGD